MLALIVSQTAVAKPAQVIVIRHGEKPPTGNELNEKGWQRAYALPTFFFTNKEFKNLGLPVAIFAMKPSEDDWSNRPVETVTPLAKALNLKIHNKFSRNELDGLVEDIFSDKDYDGKVVLICWAHKKLDNIAQKLGWEDAPKWDGDVFDRAWVLNYSGNKLVQAKDIPQNLLPGDSTK